MADIDIIGYCDTISVTLKQTVIVEYTANRTFRILSSNGTATTDFGVMTCNPYQFQDSRYSPSDPMPDLIVQYGPELANQHQIIFFEMKNVTNVTLLNMATSVHYSAPTVNTIAKKPYGENCGDWPTKVSKIMALEITMKGTKKIQRDCNGNYEIRSRDAGGLTIQTLSTKSTILRETYVSETAYDCF